MEEGFRHKLLDAMKAEDAKLRTYIEKAQLDAWYRTARDCAEQTVANAYHRLTEASKAVETLNGNGSARLVLKGRDENRPSLFGVSE
jgi:nuclear pore complex protein Nup133